MKFLMATKNRHKLIELERILSPMGFAVISINDLPDGFPDVVEDGTTFEENALLKARSGCKYTALPTVADDSGICVDALSGAPGIFSARYAGEPCDDIKNNQKLLDSLQGVEYEKRTAYYVSAIACVFPDGREFIVRGECHGHIAEKPEGNEGFGYDPLFISEKGCFGILSPEEKDKISHRSNALVKFQKEIQKYI